MPRGMCKRRRRDPCPSKCRAVWAIADGTSPSLPKRATLCCTAAIREGRACRVRAPRRSGRDALAASGLRGVPGGTRLPRPGSATFPEGRACRVRALRRSGRSGRDALVASWLRDVPGVPGGTRLSRPGSATFRAFREGRACRVRAPRRSGRDTLVASGLRDVPGGTRFRIDVHCSEVKSRTWSRQGHQEFRKFRSRLYFLVRFAHLQDIVLLTH